MERKAILNEITKSMGFVPDWLGDLPDKQLDPVWGLTSWFLSDTALKARDKALVAFGAATAVHCPY